MLTNEDAIGAVSALFETFRPEYRGNRACMDANGRPTGRHLWFFEVWGRDLAIAADFAFPYSRPNAYIIKYDAALDLPHVELDGRLCLTKVEFSTDPAEAARQVLAEALELLYAHQTGAEDDDLKEDFSNYWSQRADVGSPALSVLYDEGAATGRYLLVGEDIFAFSSNAALLRWWENRTEAAPRHTNAAHYIELSKLPKPSMFPSSPASLLELLQTHSVDGVERMLGALSQLPNGTVLVLVGTAPSGRRVFAGTRLLKSNPPQKEGSRRKRRAELRRGDVVSVGDLLKHYSIQRLRTSRLDSAVSRSVIDLPNLAGKRAVVVGCGAIGGGVARLLAKAGVGRLDLVDLELLGWENIRRHELGGRSVGLFKVNALASDLRKDLPEIVKVRSYPKTIQDLIGSGNDIVEGADLIIATTGSLHADSYIDELARQSHQPIPVIFGWMEAWGVAGHALLLHGNGARFLEGFDDGMARRPSSQSDLSPPKECGNGTTPFGSTEVAAIQAMIAELSLDCLLDLGMNNAWRTWWTSDRNLARVQGRWTDDFIEVKPASSLSGILERQWP
ncbi:ThiF family adenylyltransferase [Agrobacterium vitis]|uniref:ThiF family adenylyltransferase n=1 Tax=Agrobacterium vitis TaxID=373 RepID=UPI0012E7669A|nr:ThiF family adenylyltransferase [Agrobacterium vitis]MUZ64124.1 hypothetical protein [Agrobacterium vitis]